MKWPEGPCYACGSYCHLVAVCPDSFEKLSQVHIVDGGGGAVLVT